MALRLFTTLVPQEIGVKVSRLAKNFKDFVSILKEKDSLSFTLSDFFTITKTGKPPILRTKEVPNPHTATLCFASGEEERQNLKTQAKKTICKSSRDFT